MIRNRIHLLNINSICTIYTLYFKLSNIIHSSQASISALILSMRQLYPEQDNDEV